MMRPPSVAVDRRPLIVKPPEHTLTIDVGYGERKMSDINVDINSNIKPDVVCDVHNLSIQKPCLRYYLLLSRS